MVDETNPTPAGRPEDSSPSDPTGPRPAPADAFAPQESAVSETTAPGASTADARPGASTADARPGADTGAASGADPGPVTTLPVDGPRSRPLLTHLAAGIVGVVATLAILVAVGVVEPAGAGAAGAARPASGGTTGDGPASAGPVIGDPGAPIAIEIWADYQCPYCGLFTHGLEPSLVRDFAATGRATISYHDFAFLGQESIDAAVAARCAGRQDAYWAYHDLLFASQSGENQGAFATGNLVKLAEFAGLDTAAFGACLADPALAGEVATSTAAGKQLGVGSTPTIRIVGSAGSKLLMGLTPPAELVAAIDAVEAGKIDEAPASPGPASGSDASPAPSAAP